MQIDYPRWPSGAVTENSLTENDGDISKTIGWN